MIVNQTCNANEIRFSELVQQIVAIRILEKL